MDKKMIAKELLMAAKELVAKDSTLTVITSWFAANGGGKDESTNTATAWLQYNTKTLTFSVIVQQSEGSPDVAERNWSHGPAKEYAIGWVGKPDMKRLRNVLKAFQPTSKSNRDTGEPFDIKKFTSTMAYVAGAERSNAIKAKQKVLRYITNLNTVPEVESVWNAIKNNASSPVKLSSESSNE